MGPRGISHVAKAALSKGVLLAVVGIIFCVSFDAVVRRLHEQFLQVPAVPSAFADDLSARSSDLAYVLPKLRKTSCESGLGHRPFFTSVEAPACFP